MLQDEQRGKAFQGFDPQFPSVKVNYTLWKKNWFSYQNQSAGISDRYFLGQNIILLFY